MRGLFPPNGRRSLVQGLRCLLGRRAGEEGADGAGGAEGAEEAEDADTTDTADSADIAEGAEEAEEADTADRADGAEGVPGAHEAEGGATAEAADEAGSVQVQEQVGGHGHADDRVALSVSAVALSISAASSTSPVALPQECHLGVPQPEQKPTETMMLLHLTSLQLSCWAWSALLLVALDAVGTTVVAVELLSLELPMSDFQVLQSLGGCSCDDRACLACLIFCRLACFLSAVLMPVGTAWADGRSPLAHLTLQAFAQNCLTSVLLQKSAQVCNRESLHRIAQACS